MRVVLQRVKEASVSVDGEVLASIGTGLLVLVGVEEGDTETDADYIANKISGLRIFPDGEGKMNLACLEAPVAPEAKPLRGKDKTCLWI